ncbi:MAG: DUF5679 domain-containing protein [Patescibacteria group bacterium]
MATAYCVKCKAKQEMSEAKEVEMKNGRKAMKGKCPVCGTGMYCILGKAKTEGEVKAKTK